MFLNIIYWHSEAWSRLTGDLGALPHALLIRGQQGIGKLEFARLLAQALLCESRGSRAEPCGRCPSCNWFAAGSHPDFRELAPEAQQEDGESAGDRKASVWIGVPQVRELADFIALSSHRDGYKVILLQPAESLNPNAANALLKSLEEPPPRTIFLLVTHRPRYLLPTIVSRCRQVPLHTPEAALALEWLKAEGVKEPELALAMAGGAPLGARELAQDETYFEQRQAFLRAISQDPFEPLAAAERLKDLPLERMVGWLQRWSYDIAAAHAGSGPRYHPDYQQAIRSLASSLEPRAVTAFHRAMLRLQRIVHHPLNPRLAIESLMIGYARLRRGDAS